MSKPATKPEHFRSFEFFARAASRKQIDAVKILLKAKDKDDLVERLARGIDKYGAEEWYNFWRPIDILKRLMNFGELDRI